MENINQPEYKNLFKMLEVLKKQVNTIEEEIKKLSNNKTKKKNINKSSEKKKKQLSGFAVPVKISEELADFMSKDKQEKVARTEVTKYINEYIKLNNLQNSTDKTKISPDYKLKKLLSISDDIELSYFNLQKFMNKHFINNINIKGE